MKTSKMYLAAALLSLAAGLKTVHRDDPHRMEFELTFAGIHTAEDDWFKSRTDLWEKRELLVNAQDFVDQIQRLKAEVHK